MFYAARTLFHGVGTNEFNVGEVSDSVWWIQVSWHENMMLFYGVCWKANSLLMYMVRISKTAEGQGGLSNEPAQVRTVRSEGAHKQYSLDVRAMWKVVRVSSDNKMQNLACMHFMGCHMTVTGCAALQGAKIEYKISRFSPTAFIVFFVAP